MSELVRFKYGGTALPGNAETVTLFSTVTAFPAANMLQMLGLNRLYITLRNDQSGTLKAYMSTDRGVNWVRIVADVAVSAASANSENPYDWLVEPYADFKVDWTNGATPQGAFTPLIVGTASRNQAF